MTWIIGYMMIGLAITIWGFNCRLKCGDLDEFMARVQHDGADQLWLHILAVAVGLVIAEMLWPISIILAIQELTKNK